MPAPQPGPPPPYPPPPAPPRKAHTTRLRLDIQVGLARGSGQQDGDLTRTVLAAKHNNVATDARCEKKDQDEADRYDVIKLLLDAAATLA